MKGVRNEPKSLSPSLKPGDIMRYLIVILCVLFVPHTAYPIYTGKASPLQPEFSATRLIVKLKPEVDRQVALREVQGVVTTGLPELDRLNIRFKVQKQERLFREFDETVMKLDRFSSIYILEVEPGTDLKNMKNAYESRSEVEYAELDYRLELLEEPNDSLFPHQWYLNNTGQGYLGINRIPGNYNDTQVIKYGTADADIDALEAFERGDETTIPLVGIIDTGIDLDHDDLVDHVWTNPGEIPDNGIDDDHNGFADDFYGWDFSGDSLSTEIVGDNDPTDYFGHGTHCAGITAAVRNNTIGVSGINTPCRIMAIKFFPNAFFSLGARSIIYAADMGCDVINMSWGSQFYSRVIEDALDYAIDKGVLPIAAAGNSGAEDHLYPASLPQVFTVGASNSDDEVTGFSTYGDQIEVVAPGEDILSLRGDSTDMYAGGGASGIEPTVHIVDDIYYLADGTSMASPCAVGVAAYILAASPGISTARVREIIEQSADDVIYPYGGDSLYSPGKDIYSGYGRVNLNSALELLTGRLAKIDYPYENAIVSGEVAIMGTASGDSFQNYVLEYGEGYSPGEWTEIISSDVPVTSDTLGVWNSISLTGLYTLRLTVVDQNQALVRVITSNDVYVKITSPAEGDTIFGKAEMWGYTVVPDFSHYTLKYGYGESPSFWIPMDSSTKMVADNVLGSLLVSFFEEMSYTFLLTVETGAGEIYADTVMVWVRGITSGGWVQDLAGMASFSPAVGDIDGDGYDEIVIGIDGVDSSGIWVFSHEGEREVGWPKDITRKMRSSPALGDLDGDGVDDVVICSNAGIHAYRSSSSNWFRSASTVGNDWGLATPLIADLETDGDLEVLTINSSGTIYAWRNDGQSVISGNAGVFAQADDHTFNIGFPCMAVADLDKDGQNEVIGAVASSAGGGIYIWDTDANPLLGPENYPDEFFYLFGMAIADIDEDEDLEMLVLGMDTNHSFLHAFKKDGSQPAAYPIVLEDVISGWFYGNQPSIGDLDRDGILEIVITVWTVGEGRVYAWHQDGTPLGSVGSGGLIASIGSTDDGERKRQVPSRLGNDIGEMANRLKNMNEEERAGLISTLDEDPVFASAPETFGNPVLFDVNQDRDVDIIVRAGYLLGEGYERVFAWDYEGNLIPGWPLYASSEVSVGSYYPFTPVMVDMNRDGRLNVVVATDWPDYQLISWEFDNYYDPTTAHWPMYMHDQQNSSVFRIEDYTAGQGDANGDGAIDAGDVVYLIDYLYRDGPAPNPPELGDANCDGAIDPGDVVYLINYLFREGPPPPC
jgi:hypothetical protein